MDIAPLLGGANLSLQRSDPMSDVISQLEPKHVWKYFTKMTSIPHQSKNEAEIGRWLQLVGKEHNLEMRTDEVGNIVLCVPATPGHENAPIVILQGHMDMVCEANNDSKHDFAKDPLKLQVNGEWLSATGTTLGADNGVGLAAALALLDDPTAVHGPLEILATMDEETGMTGAFNLKTEFLKGRMMLNLDSEEDGAIYVGCAGGADVKAFFDTTSVPAAAGSVMLEVGVGGLRGGHSGLNIIENRANALRMLARVLKNLQQMGVEFTLTSLSGGSAHNAIPREATAGVVLGEAHAARAKELIEKRFTAMRAEYGKRETRMSLICNDRGAFSGSVWGAAKAASLVDFMLLVPNGALTMSQDLPNLVESSCNLATVKSDGDRVIVHLSCRSSVQPVIPEIQETIAIAAVRSGARAELGEGYPAWQPDMDSPLLATAKGVFEEVFGRIPEIKAIHAGLECGIIGEKFPGIRMISFGPEIHGAHSPEEKVHIPSVDRFYRALCGILKNLA
ncbi:MAG: cytosol nonspecific dipeptidase [Deltaproteobacteria bacterium HGW-Deltaproteobacteria-22]|nr:MAG: cytosol nonspecific dipeptidase [Deltaproteobacteria bacterium HGW-Deltaproteobacteria-22]